jgi:ribosomal protein L29
MKKKDLQALKSKSIEELKKMVSDKKKEADEAFIKTKAGQEKNLKKVKNLRKDIAQILTLVKEKEIVEEEKKGDKDK